MTLEQFLREHAARSNSEMILRLEIDAHTKDVTAIFEDTYGTGRTAHVRIVKDKVIFMSFCDGKGGDKPELPSVAASKQKALAEQQAADDQAAHDAALKTAADDEERRLEEAADQAEIDFEAGEAATEGEAGAQAKASLAKALPEPGAPPTDPKNMRGAPRPVGPKPKGKK